MDEGLRGEDGILDDQTARLGSKSRLCVFLLLPVLASILIWSLNYLLLDREVGQVLGADSRNSGFAISAHYRFYIDPSVLILNLRSVSSAAPQDLYRGLFQSAAALDSTGRGFDRVILARSGSAVYLMTGEEFRKVGSEFNAGQNPVYMVRTLPEKLYKPTGEAAFGHWEGGVLGVLAKQMADANEAARKWAAGN